MDISRMRRGPGETNDVTIQPPQRSEGVALEDEHAASAVPPGNSRRCRSHSAPRATRYGVCGPDPSCSPPQYRRLRRRRRPCSRSARSRPPAFCCVLTVTGTSAMGAVPSPKTSSTTARAAPGAAPSVSANASVIRSSRAGITGAMRSQKSHGSYRRRSCVPAARSRSLRRRARPTASLTGTCGGSRGSR
jgi:hypothetical protein